MGGQPSEGGSPEEGGGMEQLPKGAAPPLAEALLFLAKRAAAYAVVLVAMNALAPAASLAHHKVPALLPRYLDLNTPGGIVRAIDIAACMLYAVAGAITAAGVGMDLLGTTMVGVITAIGGGTWRDIMLGCSPVFWMEEVEYIYLCGAMAAATFALWPKVKPWSENGYGKLFMDYGDALGMAAFCIIGSHKAMMRGFDPLICIICGMFTSTFGGVTRDLLCKLPPRIFHAHAEIFATCSLVGGGVYVACQEAHLPLRTCVLVSMTCTMIMRHLAMSRDIRLPTRV